MDEFEICKRPTCSKTKDCIIAQKIFDQCRIQVCLTPGIIGPARAASCGQSCCKPTSKGDIIVPPCNAVSVTVRNFCVTGVSVISKAPSSLRCGYWDITVKFTFSYCLAFFDTDSKEITTMSGYSNYTTTLCLYGGENMCVSLFNELYPDIQHNGPFISVEASGMALAACLSYPCPTTQICCNCNSCGNCGNTCNCGTCGNTNNCGTCGNTNNCGSCGNTNNCGGCGNTNNCGGCGNTNNCGSCGNTNNCGSCGGIGSCGACGSCRPSNIVNNCECTSFGSTSLIPVAVNVTIGLFAVVKLFRLSNMCIENFGDCMPEECSVISPETLDPCTFFDGLDFPVNLFAPQSDYTPSCEKGSTAGLPGNCCCFDKPDTKPGCCFDKPDTKPNYGCNSNKPSNCNCGYCK